MSLINNSSYKLDKKHTKSLRSSLNRSILFAKGQYGRLKVVPGGNKKIPAIAGRDTLREKKLKIKPLLISKQRYVETVEGKEKDMFFSLYVLM